jgi:ATP synthase protein I
MLRGALIPTLIVAMISLVSSSLYWGTAGFVGAALAQFIVIVFFASNLLAARISRDLDPTMTMAIAMFSYVAKVAMLGIFLWLITTYVPESSCNRAAFGISAVGATFAWLGGEIGAYLKLKLHLQLPPPAK